MTRRRFLLAAGAAALGGAAMDALAIEPRRVTVTRHRLGTLGGPRWRLAQVSDLHLDRLDDHARRVADVVASLAPDVIALTGDQVNGPHALDALARFVARLDGAPIVAIFGNWERGTGVEPAAMADALSTANGRLLVNETATLEHAGRRIRITGLDDLVGGLPDLRGALGNAPGDPALQILLQHCPHYRDLVPAAAWFDVMLAGHTHGGQVAPFGWAPVRPKGSGPYVAGWYRDSDPPMYVSRGIGTVILPVRFMAPPEIAVFEWGLP